MVTERGYRLWCSLDERAICRPILVNNYERPETRFVEKTVKLGDKVIDAGANVGYFSLLFASLVGEGGKVDAFEPLAYLADALEASIAENEFQTRMTLHRLALDEVAGDALIRHAPRTANFGGAHLALKGPLPAAHIDEKIQTVRLDEKITRLECHFLKLDVEEAEPRVIRGATRILANSHPVIMSELHNEQLRVVSGINATSFISQMKALQYHCRLIDQSGDRGAVIDHYDGGDPINVVFDYRPA
jgi:FkbM family methyltransferase